MAVAKGVQHITRLFSRLSTGTVSSSVQTSFLERLAVRHCSTYEPYSKLEETPSPFKQRGKDRIGYKLKIYTGGEFCRCFFNLIN